MSEDTVWTVFLTSAPGAAATPAGSFASREDALAWIAALPDHVRRRAMPPLPLSRDQRAAPRGSRAGRSASMAMPAST